MLINRGAHEPGLASRLVEAREEFCLLVVMVLMDTVVLGYAVACEV
jgi:hypothetical protein